MATVAELQAVLDLNNKPFLNSLKQAEVKSKSSFSKMSGVFSGLGGMLGKAFVPAAIGAAVVGTTKSVLDFAGAIKDQADALSMDTDKFQQFTFAVEQASGKQEDFVRGMGALISKMEEAKDGNEKARQDFADLGITLAEINELKPEAMFLRFADVLKAANGDIKTTADVMDILGSKVSLKLIPSMKDGSEAFLEMGRAGRIMEAQNVAALEGLGDKLAAFKRKAFNVAGNNLGIAANAMQGNQFKPPAPEVPATMMDEIVVTPGRRPGFWQQDLPTMTKRTGNEEVFGPMPSGNSSFAGFGSGYFPGKSGGLTSGGLTTGSIQGSGGLGDAYHKVRSGDAARARESAKEAKKNSDPAMTATAENTAALVEAWGGKGKRK